MSKKVKFDLADFRIEWISEKIDEHAIHFMEGLGIDICDKKVLFDAKLEQYYTTDDRTGFNAVTTSQIRNIFGEVKRIELKVNDGNWEEEKIAFLLLKPKIAYGAARVTAKQKDSKIKSLKSVLDRAYSAVSDVKQFKRFSNLLEGILAYHKANGGRD